MQEPVKEAGTIVLTVMVRETKFIFFLKKTILF